jgi:hypothetical protein
MENGRRASQNPWSRRRQKNHKEAISSLGIPNSPKSVKVERKNDVLRSTERVAFL